MNMRAINILLMDSEIYNNVRIARGTAIVPPKKSNDIFSSFRDAVSIICRIFVVAK